MKKVLSILLLSITLFSCSSNDDTIITNETITESFNAQYIGRKVLFSESAKFTVTVANKKASLFIKSSESNLFYEDQKNVEIVNNIAIFQNGYSDLTFTLSFSEDLEKAFLKYNSTTLSLEKQ